MSIIKSTNTFKNKNIGSVKDYKDRYNYLNERDIQKYDYKRNKKDRNIQRTKQDRLLNTEDLKARIENTKDRNKLKLVKTMTNNHTITVITFSIISGLLSSIGVGVTVIKNGNIFGCISVVLLTIIMLLGINIVIQPKLINSLYFKQSINKYIGCILLGIASIGVFVVSIKTNKVTLDLLNLPPILSYAFTLVFDVSVTGLNFLNYQTCMFDVSDKVKNDLGVNEQPIPTPQPKAYIETNSDNIIGFKRNDNIKTAEKVEEYINNLETGEPIIIKDIDANYSTALKYINEHHEDLPILKDNTNSKFKYIRG